MTQDTDLSRVIPLIVHGDDAECHRRRSFLILSYASVLVGRCAVWDNRFLVYCLDNHVACNETVDELDYWAAWSFTELQHGRWLEHGPQGQELPHRKGMEGKPIAGGYRAVICFFRGDEKYTQKSFHTKVAWNSEQICWRCKASRVHGSDLLYTHFGPGAKHRQTMLCMSDFLTTACKPSAWIRVPGFDPAMLHFDWLHVVDLTLVPEASATDPWLWGDNQFVF